MLTSPIFTRQMKQNGRNIKIRAAYPFLFPLLLIKLNNTIKEGRRREGGGGQLSLMTDRCTHSRSHTETTTEEHTHSRDAAWGTVS